MDELNNKKNSNKGIHCTYHEIVVTMFKGKNLGEVRDEIHKLFSSNFGVLVALGKFYKARTVDELSEKIAVEKATKTTDQKEP